MGINDYADRVALVTRVHDENHEATDPGGMTHVWTGKRPMIDVLFVGIDEEDPDEWEICQAENIPHHQDVITRLSLEGKQGQMLVFCPRYAVVQNMEGQ